MNASDLVDVRDLTVRRGTFRLELPRWRVPPGLVLGLVGPNGAGKTTLLESLAGLRATHGGTARVFGLDPWKEQARVRSELGFMGDDMPLFAMRVGALLRMLSGYYSTWDGALVEELLDRFKLDPRMQVYELSKGQGTRLRLITAMAFRPRLLLLDEPAAGLDLGGRMALLDSVLDVVRDPTRSVIVSSHLLLDVERISDRLLVLKEGRVVREGPTNDLVGDGQTLEEALVAWGAAG